MTFDPGPMADPSKGKVRRLDAFPGYAPQGSRRGAAALETLGRAMSSYLQMQLDAGADVVQLFASWAGVLDRESFETLDVPPARTCLDGVTGPRICIAPGGGQTLDLQPIVDADGFGVDRHTPPDDMAAFVEAVRR